MTWEDKQRATELARYRGVRLFLDHGRIKAECRHSSSGYTWIGFCQLCTLDCPLQGVSVEEVREKLQLRQI